MLKDRPYANAGITGLFHPLTLDKTMIDRISRPRLLLEKILTHFG